MKKKIGNIIREKNFSSLASNITVAAMGLFSFMLLARQLDQAFFGDWILFLTLASFIDLLRFGLTSTSTVRLLSHANALRVKVLLGSSYRINLVLCIIITVVCYLLLAIIKWTDPTQSSGYILFLQWYPLLSFFNLSWNNACTLFQAQQNFKRMMYVKLSNIGIFTVFLTINYFFLKLGPEYIMGVFLGTNLLSSVWCIAKKWDGLRFLNYRNKETVNELVYFGKYSMGTLVGSSLLRSADTFIIGLSPVMGATAIAMYAIPLKLTDLLGIPLRSLTMTAYPKMSKKVIQGDMDGARSTFYAYSGAITIAFIPVALFCFVFAEELIVFMGGKSYAEHTGQLMVIFRIFTLYTILLPIDRFTGVMLDSVNKPRLNMYKVIVMTLANVIVDLIAVFVFNSLEWVAIGTVLFTIAGIFLGFYYLKREINIKSRYIIPESIHFFKNLNSYIAK